MDLTDFIYAGGAGSGCRGPKCGRPEGGGKSHAGEVVIEVPLSKSEVARLYFKPSTQLKQAIADKSEQELSKGLKLPRTADNSPFDLQTKKIGVEVKTLVDNANSKLTMHPESRMRKIAAARKHGLRMYTIAVDRRTEGVVRYYAASGVGSFRIASMKEFTTMAALKRFIV